MEILYSPDIFSQIIQFFGTQCEINKSIKLISKTTYRIVVNLYSLPIIQNYYCDNALCYHIDNIQKRKCDHCENIYDCLCHFQLCIDLHKYRNYQKDINNNLDLLDKKHKYTISLNHLTDESVYEQIEQLIEMYTNVKIINIIQSFNNNTIHRFLQLLETKRNLTNLHIDLTNIYNCEIYFQSIQNILLSNYKLQSIHINNNFIFMKNISIFLITIKKLLFLKTLSLNNIKLNTKHIQYLINNTKLNNLILIKCNINDKSIQPICEHLHNNFILKKLILSENKITDNGIYSLSNALKLNTSITKLSISSNPFTEIGAQYLIDMIQINNSILDIFCYSEDMHVGRITEEYKYLTNVMRECYMKKISKLIHKKKNEKKIK
jgi:hypothetical protein